MLLVDNGSFNVNPPGLLSYTSTLSIANLSLNCFKVMILKTDEYANNQVLGGVLLA